jgi:hypothetical protein
MDTNLRAQALRMAIDSLTNKDHNIDDIFTLSDRYIGYILGQNKVQNKTADRVFTPAEVIQFKRCQENVVYFVNNFYKYQHPQQGRIPLSLYDYQITTLNSFNSHRYNIVNAARQMGSSIVGCSYVLWYSLFHHSKTSLIITNRLSNAAELLDRIYEAYSDLPDFINIGITRRTKTEIVFDNNSRIICIQAGENVGRGMAYNLLWIDNCAFISHKIGYSMWYSLMPTASSLESKIILTSTGGGDTHGIFYDIWTKSDLEFNKIYLPWNLHPGRTEEFRREYIDLLGEKKFSMEFEGKFISQRGENV